MKTFNNPPPVEELDDLAWKRVELGLVARLATEESAVHRASEPRANKKAWLVGGAALACAAAALLFVVIRDGSKTEAPALVHAQISELATQDSSTSLELLGARMEVAAHSAISVEQGDNRLRIDLQEGSVRLKVAKRDDMREPVAVVAGDVRVEVMGTEFAVYRYDSEVKVEVFEGVVRVTSKGERNMVRAGETWPATELAENDKAEQETLVMAPKHEQDRVRSNKGAAEKNPVKDASASASALFDEAQALEVSDPDRAARLYRQAARAKGPWAANALFAEARLELSRNNEDRGKTLLRRYARNFPKGANIADVLSLLGQ